MFVFLSCVVAQNRLIITSTTANWVDVLESIEQGDIITFEAGI